jgi:hypothetical protein
MKARRKHLVYLISEMVDSDSDFAENGNMTIVESAYRRPSGQNEKMGLGG